MTSYEHPEDNIQDGIPENNHSQEFNNHLANVAGQSPSGDINPTSDETKKEAMIAVVLF